MLFDVDDRGVQLAAGPVGRLGENPGPGGVAVLQGLEGQSRLAVCVFEQPNDLLRRTVLVPPRREAFRDRIHLFAVIRRSTGRGPVLRPQTEVEDQRQAVTRRDRPNLVPAVGVEGREGEARGLLHIHVHRDLAAPVADDQLPALSRDGE